MPVVHHHIIEAPPECVFEVIADLQNLPRWVGAIHEVRGRFDGPIGVGTRFEEVGRFMGRELVLAKQVTEFDPPRTITHGCPAGPIRNVLRFDLAAVEQGTSVTLTALDEPHRLVGVVRLAAQRWVRHELARNLERLGRLIEGADRPGGR